MVFFAKLRKNFFTNVRMLFSFLLTVFVILCVAACSDNNNMETHSTISKTVSPTSNNFSEMAGHSPEFSKIEMVTEFSEYSSDVTEITVIITNNNANDEYSYSRDYFSLQRYENGSWTDVTFKENGDFFHYGVGIVAPFKNVKNKYAKE